MDSASQVRPGRVLAVLSVAAFMASLDLFIVNVAFRDIGQDFPGSSLSTLSWVLNAYAILYAALLVPLGRLADRYGQKAGFLLGLGVFVLGSAACAASEGLWQLVAFRGLQAAGAAALTPTSIGLLLAATPAERRVRAVRIWAATGGLAAAAGPVVGGLLIEASWRWVFLVNLPIGLAALVFAWRIVPAPRHDRDARVPDLLGVAVLAVAVALLALGLVEAPDWGWGSARVLGSLAASVVLGAGFWWRSEHHASPVVEPALLRVRAFAWSNATAVAFSAAFAAGLLANVLWLQGVWHYSALRTGLAVTPGPLMVPVFAAVAQRVSARVPVGRIAAAGCLVFGLGSVVILLSLGEQPHYLREALPGWLMTGVGVGLALPTILSSATADLPPQRTATGSAVVNMSRQVGTVLGVSALVAILGSPVGYEAVHRAYVEARWVVAVVCVVGAVAALGMTPRRQVVAEVLPVEVPSVVLAEG